MRGPIRWLRATSGIPWRKRLRHHINLVRWTLDRCDGCGHRFAWKGDARFGQNSQTFHQPCLNAQMWHTKADERLEVLAAICDVWEITESDMRDLMQNRDEARGWDLAWRVFRDMRHAQPTEEQP